MRVQGQHSLLLEVLGERNEHVEQLEEDIRDMKRIFHEQVYSRLTGQVRHASPCIQSNPKLGILTKQC